MEIKNFDENKKPIFIYTSEAYNKILNYNKTEHAAQMEYMFLGTIARIKNFFVLVDTYIVPQKTYAMFCETDDNRYPLWLSENIPLEMRKDLRLHGHSHVRINTHPSGTDDKQIIELVNEVSDFFVQLIVNLRMENTVNIYDKTNGFVYTDVEQYIHIADNAYFTTDCKIPAMYLNNMIIPDGNYEINNSILKINDNTHLNLITGEYVVSDEFLTISTKKGITSNKKVDYNKLMNEMVNRNINPLNNFVNEYPYEPFDDTIEEVLDESE